MKAIIIESLWRFSSFAKFTGSRLRNNLAIIRRKRPNKHNYGYAKSDSVKKNLLAQSDKHGEWLEMLTFYYLNSFGIINESKNIDH